MTVWAAHDLKQIGASDDLHVAPLRADGVTYGTPTWIWSVVVGPELIGDRAKAATVRIRPRSTLALDA